MDPYSEALADAIEAALPGWVERCVVQRVADFRGTVEPEVIVAARRAGEQARVEVGGEVRRLLALDVDLQRTNPLALLRAAVRYPTAVLDALGIPGVVRDEFAVRSFPADEYDLSPANWADVDESLHEPGLLWGAWKAATVLGRRRAEPLRPDAARREGGSAS